MRISNVRKRLDEYGTAIQTLGTLYAWVPGLVDDFLVQFEKGFDVVACKRDRNQNQVRLALLDVVLYSVASLRSKPC